MTDWPILSTVTFVPLVGVLLILLIRDDSETGRRNIRNVSLIVWPAGSRYSTGSRTT
jgi:NADH-quinone oxidoreductase subunit M